MSPSFHFLYASASAMMTMYSSVLRETAEKEPQVSRMVPPGPIASEKSGQGERGFLAPRTSRQQLLDRERGRTTSSPACTRRECESAASWTTASGAFSELQKATRSAPVLHAKTAMQLLTVAGLIDVLLVLEVVPWTGARWRKEAKSGSRRARRRSAGWSCEACSGFDVIDPLGPLDHGHEPPRATQAEVAR